MGELLALASALCFGATDFLCGLLSRRVHSFTVAFAGQLCGSGLILVAAPWFPASQVSGLALAWGAVSGVGTGLGAAFLFRAMSAGRFSIVVPLSDVAGVALPVLVGVALLGDRPALWAWCGIAAAAPAVWLMTSSDHGSGGADSPAGSGARDALVSGAGFALQYIAMAQTDPAAGLWPLLANRVASVMTILPLVVSRPARLRIPPVPAGGAAASGILGLAALVMFTLASREQVLSVAVVLTSLYPAIPVLLGLTVLHERLTRTQVAGLLSGAAAVVLIALP